MRVSKSVGYFASSCVAFVIGAVGFSDRVEMQSLQEENEQLSSQVREQESRIIALVNSNAKFRVDYLNLKEECGGERERYIENLGAYEGMLCDVEDEAKRALRARDIEKIRGDYYFDKVS